MDFREKKCVSFFSTSLNANFLVKQALIPGAKRIRKKLAEFKWQKGLHSPVGSSQSPPTERQWKVTDAGQQFLLDNPNGKGGVDTALNNMINLLVNKDNVVDDGGLKSGCNERHGFVRVKNSETNKYQ